MAAAPSIDFNHFNDFTPEPQATAVPTACVLCSHNCGLEVDVADGQIVAVRADDAHPTSQGYVCNKAFSIARYAHHAQRVQTPLKRTPDGTFQPITWDQAIAEIGDRLAALHRTHGPKSIAFVGGGGQANHLDVPYALSWLQAVGSPRWFNAYAQEKTQNALLDQWMFQASPVTTLHADDAHTDYLVCWGTNPKISNRGHNPTDTLKALSRDPKRTLVVVDPRLTETARTADVHLPVAPGGDAFLLLGMLATIVNEGLVDQGFLDRHVNGMDQLRALLADIDVAKMAAQADIALDQLQAVARGYANARTATVLWDLGLEQARFSTLNAWLVRVLAVITGNLGTRGGSTFLQSFNPPDFARVERARTDRATVSGIPGIRALGSWEMYSPSLVPEEVLTDHPDRIRAVVVEGANPMLGYSDTNRWREAIDAMDLLVVIDPAMSETAQLADYVLPAPVGYEKWEMSAFPKGYDAISVHLRRPVVSGPPDALQEAEIFARLGERMGLFGKIPRGLQRLARRLGGSTRGRTVLLAAATSAAAATTRALDPAVVQARLLFWWYRLIGDHLPAPALAGFWLVLFKNALHRRAGVIRVLGPQYARATPVRLADALMERLLASPRGADVALLDTTRQLADNVRTPDGRVRLVPPQMPAELRRALAAKPIADTAFPLVLSAGVRTPWTANTIQRDPKWRKGRGPHCYLSIGPSDADSRGLTDGATAVLQTTVGQAEIAVRIDDRLRPGHVAVPNGFGMRYVTADGTPTAPDGLNLNTLTAAGDRDPFTGCPHHKNVACQVTAAVH